MGANANSRTYRRQQSGMALAVALVMLMVVLALGVAAVRMTGNEERMTGYAQDRNLAFQAAEAALLEIEERLESLRRRPEPSGNSCPDEVANGIPLRVCTTAPTGAQPRWLDAGFMGWSQASTVGSGARAITPEYLVEYLGNDFICDIGSSGSQSCSHYRITTRVRGNGRAAVMLQSVYSTD